uniref:Reverse transcriptase domain-containing protein n=1 Tax=Tanacetum cinerariifolium TaxID=118510 RepID=A0A6L2JD15_TANCI|nr:hypothetical protein [Tanacetum cinerariifolium]
MHNFPKGTLCSRDRLRAQHLMDILGGAASMVADDLLGPITGVIKMLLSGKYPSQLRECIASAPLTRLVKPGGNICPIVVGTVCIPSSCEAILHSMNRLTDSKGNDIGLSMLLVDFKNAFNLVDRGVLLKETRTINQSCEITLQACYLDDGTIVKDTLMVAKALDIIKIDGPVSGLFLNGDKTKLFWHVEDPKSRAEGVFPINISRPLNGVKLLVVTTSGLRFGDWQWRLATLPIKLGGLGIISAGDISQYTFLTSRLQTSTLRAKRPMKTGIESQMMKTLAKCYFGVIEKDLVSKERCQFESISYAILRWRDPVDRLSLVFDRLAKLTPSFSRVKKSNIHDESNVVQCKHKLGDGNFTTAIKVITSSSVAPSTPNTLHELESKHPYAPPLTFRDRLRAQHLMDILGGATSTVADDLLGPIIGVINMLLSGKYPSQLGECIASTPLTPLVKPGGDIWPIVVGTVCIPGSCEAILHSMNRLTDSKGNDIGLSVLLVDFKNAFNLVDRGVLLKETKTINQSCEITLQACYLDDGTIVKNTLMVAKALDIIKIDGPASGLFLNGDKTKLFWHVEDPKSRAEGVFTINISRPLNGVKLQVVTASGLRFGDWQCRLATLPIKLGGLGIISAGDISQYTFLTCRLQTSALRAKIPMKTGIESQGDHAIHCSSELGVKFRLNLMCDILGYICSKIVIMVRKEAPMGFLSEDRKDLRPVDLLLFNWLQGKDACLDVTCISPFAGMRAYSWDPGVVLHNDVEKKKRKYAFICKENEYKFIPFAFSTFWEFDTEALDTLSRTKSISISHSNNAKSGAFIFRVSFCIQKRVVRNSFCVTTFTQLP